jgi:hypothetical protein
MVENVTSLGVFTWNMEALGNSRWRQNPKWRPKPKNFILAAKWQIFNGFPKTFERFICRTSIYK